MQNIKMWFLYPIKSKLEYDEVDCVIILDLFSKNVYVEKSKQVIYFSMEYILIQNTHFTFHKKTVPIHKPFDKNINIWYYTKQMMASYLHGNYREKLVYLKPTADFVIK